MGKLNGLARNLICILCIQIVPGITLMSFCLLLSSPSGRTMTITVHLNAVNVHSRSHWKSITDKTLQIPPVCNRKLST